MGKIEKNCDYKDLVEVKVLVQDIEHARMDKDSKSMNNKEEENFHGTIVKRC